MATVTQLGAAAEFSVGGVDLKDQLQSLTLTYTKEALEVTTLADTARKFTGGLENNECTFTVLSSFVTGEAAQTLFGDVGTTATIIFRPSGSGEGASDPEYTLTGAYLASAPLVVNVGELNAITVTFQGGTLVQDITP